MNKDYSVTTSIRLPLGVRSEIDRIAKKQNRSVNWVINQAISDYLKKANKKD